MKTPVITMVLLLSSVSLPAQNTSAFPTTWTKDLIIQFTFSGSMDGSLTEGRMTFDSCVVTYQSGQKAPVKGSYRMKATDRSTILKKLRELKADQIKGESARVSVNDGWNQLIRIGDLRLEGGTSVEMTEENRMRFGQVYSYLEGFALRKASPK